MTALTLWSAEMLAESLSLAHASASSTAATTTASSEDDADRPKLYRLDLTRACTSPPGVPTSTRRRRTLSPQRSERSSEKWDWTGRPRQLSSRWSVL
jgi:hypothetical protein